MWKRLAHNVKLKQRQGMPNFYKLMDKSFLQNIRKYWIEL